MDFQFNFPATNANYHSDWLTLYTSDADANPDGDGWTKEDATGTAYWHPYTNIEEYLVPMRLAPLSVSIW